jgi:hypothetical protein
MSAVVRVSKHNKGLCGTHAQRYMLGCGQQMVSGNTSRHISSRHISRVSTSHCMLCAFACVCCACTAGATCANGENNTFDEDTCLVLPEWAIRSGPRGTIYFDPEKVRQRWVLLTAALHA